MSQVIRWGILGTGFIAKRFAHGLSFLPDAELLAVGSRTLSSAENFAAQFNIPRAYENYERLVSDKDIDIVYVATPNTRHKDDCLLCFEAGKPVLCEKAFAINAGQAREIIAAARQKQLFVMEAMWMRFIPLMGTIRSLIQEGCIGKIRMVVAGLGFKKAFNPTGRHFNPHYGGGALLDFGSYPLSLAYDVLGSPSHIVGQPSIATTGIDEQASMILQYPEGQLAILYSTVRAQAPNEAFIIGEKGQIKIHAPFYRPHHLSISKSPTFQAVPTTSSPRPQSWPSLKEKGISYIKRVPFIQHLYLWLDAYVSPMLSSNSQKIVVPLVGNGYHYQAAEAMRCLRNGEPESRVMPLDETVRILETMDTIRAQWNVKYPGE